MYFYIIFNFMSMLYLFDFQLHNIYLNFNPYITDEL